VIQAHRCFSSLLALLVLATGLWAQQDMGVITGLVTDPSGATVVGARVTSTNLDTNETRTVQSSETGTYTIGPLRIGRYSIAVETQGFKRAVWPELRVSAQDRVRADVQLEVGQITEAISVTA